MTILVITNTGSVTNVAAVTVTTTIQNQLHMMDNKLLSLLTAKYIPILQQPHYHSALKASVWTPSQRCRLALLTECNTGLHQMILSHVVHHSAYWLADNDASHCKIIT